MYLNGVIPSTLGQTEGSKDQSNPTPLTFIGANVGSPDNQLWPFGDVGMTKPPGPPPKMLCVSFLIYHTTTFTRSPLY